MGALTWYFNEHRIILCVNIQRVAFQTFRSANKNINLMFVIAIMANGDLGLSRMDHFVTISRIHTLQERWRDFATKM